MTKVIIQLLTIVYMFLKGDLSEYGMDWDGPLPDDLVDECTHVEVPTIQVNITDGNGNNCIPCWTHWIIATAMVLTCIFKHVTF